MACHSSLIIGFKLSQPLSKGETYSVFKITNTGEYDGAEVVQLYTRDLVASLARPVRELKGFQKIWLKAGESQTVQFELTTTDLAFWHADKTHYAESGEFQVWVSTDSQSGEPVVLEYN